MTPWNLQKSPNAHQKCGRSGTINQQENPRALFQKSLFLPEKEIPFFSNSVTKNNRGGNLQLFYSTKKIKKKKAMM